MLKTFNDLVISKLLYIFALNKKKYNKIMEKTTVEIEENLGKAFERMLNTHKFKCDTIQISPQESKTITKDIFDLINKTDKLWKKKKQQKK